MKTRILTLLVIGLLTARAAAFQAGDAFEQAMLRGDYERAVTIAETLARQHPDHAVAAYNAACACSRAGHAGRAIEWLMGSAQLGFSGVRSIRDDDDLDAVRTHTGFAAVREAVEANVQARFDAFRAAAEKSRPTVILPPRHDPGVAAVRGTKGYSWVFRDESEWLVLRTIDEARKQWKIGPVILTGFSQGANIALMLGQSHPARFHAVIPVSGHYETDVAEVPTDGPRPRWCLMIGERDPWAATYAAAERDLGGAGMKVRHDIVPGLGHAMPRGSRGSALMREVLTWAIETSDEG